MSRTGKFVIAAAVSLIVLALAAITKAPALLALAALALGVTALAFPRQMAANRGGSYDALPSSPWVVRVVGAVLVAAAVLIAVGAIVGD